MPRTEQKETQASVGNPTNLWGQKTQHEQKQILLDANFQFDPRLIAAIIRRNTDSIKSSIYPTEHFHKNKTTRRETLRESQFDALRDFYGKALLANPVKLALKICDSEITETTPGNDPTRFDVLHCLAENWDQLIESAKRKEHSVPDLPDVLEYARGLNNHIPLHTFILGLSEENKEKAADILNAKASSAPST